MQDFFSKLLAPPRAAALIFAASLGALLFALTMQYGFGLEPCVLCLWQRVPFAVAAVLALAALAWRPYAGRTRILLALCAAAFAIEAALAVFHSGVELHWWLGTSGCAIEPLHGTSAEDLRMQLLHTVVARCDQITWTFLGFSMANWNVPFSSALAAFAALAAAKK